MSEPEVESVRYNPDAPAEAETGKRGKGFGGYDLNAAITFDEPLQLVRELAALAKRMSDLKGPRAHEWGMIVPTAIGLLKAMEQAQEPPAR
jgi:hypothetical protein